MFERYLTAEPQLGWRGKFKGNRKVVLVASVIAHGVLLVGLIIYQFIRVEEVPPPALTVTFFSASAPPPPPPPPPAKKKSTPKPKVKPVVAPTEIPQLVQPETPPEPVEEDTGEDEGVEGGVEGGVAGGVVGGVIGGQVAPEPPPKPKNVPPHVLEQSRLTTVKPKMPSELAAQYAGRDVTVIVLVCIQTSGEIDRDNTRVISAPPGDRSWVLSAVHQWKYKAQPIPVCAPVRFVIKVEK